ncbi:MAG: hypothetical protein KAG97_04600 [Victivallales bacterium]|nr:hypothetical protein [Victivallales bacterium]
MKMLCPYCEVEISMSAVDVEGGLCPKCGTIISSTSIFAAVGMVEDDLDNELDNKLDDDF